MTAKSVCKNLISDENDPPIDGRNAHSGVLAPDLLRLSDHGISRGLSHNLLNAPLPENITTNQGPLAKAAVQYDAACQFSSPPHQETNAMPQNVSLRVPVEVWLRIFRYATVTSQHSLVQAVATCSDFHGPAEEALYTFPTIFNKWTANRFHSTVAESPHRARMVRGLRLVCSPKQADDCIAALKETFPLLIRVETIELAFSGKEECLPRPTATSLIEGTSSNPHSLRRIRGLPLYASRHLIRCLSKYPHLEELHLYQYSPLIEDDEDGDDDDDEDVDDDEDGDVDNDDDDSDDDDDYEDSERPEECMLGVLKKLRVLSCPRTMVSRLKSAGTITSLCITEAERDVMDNVATLFGHQLVSLRLHRELGNYSGMAYPTNWFKWEKLPLLKFLDIQDRGRRGREIEGQVIRAESLPHSLVALVWAPSWAMDCALVDSRPEQWRRNKIRDFADTVLRRAGGVKTVVYRWSKGKAYECALKGKDQSYCEVLADSLTSDEYAWVDKR